VRDNKVRVDDNLCPHHEVFMSKSIKATTQNPVNVLHAEIAPKAKLSVQPVLYSSKQYPFSIGVATLLRYPDRVFESDSELFYRTIRVMDGVPYCCALKKDTQVLYIAQRSWTNKEPKPF